MQVLKFTLPLLVLGLVRGTEWTIEEFVEVAHDIYNHYGSCAKELNHMVFHSIADGEDAQFISYQGTVYASCTTKDHFHVVHKTPLYRMNYSRIAQKFANTFQDCLEILKEIRQDITELGSWEIS